ncbi:hypothetical protein MKZ38_004742 [Zalerion maritima]|uniref:Zinc-finger domain-containing protein n=1 Tax=Zalerion maritima TaxID=339359 RepID=A0AAD5RWC9_9PEZI|nr:hypothetical protein MKZ38_004742 [Zalerion maritima]
MSHYPPYGYGQYQAPQPHQQHYSYPPMPYQQSTSGYPPTPSMVDHQQQQHYAMPQGSYEYSPGGIPGLAMGGPNSNPMPSQSPYGPPPSNSPWDQPQQPPHQYHDHQEPGYPLVQQQQPQPQAQQQQLEFHHTALSYPPHLSQPQQPHYQQPPLMTEQQHQASTSYPTIPVEDAELSEGEFEDLYEPHDPEKELQRVQEEERKKQRRQQHNKKSSKPQVGNVVERIIDDANNDGSLYGSGSEAGEVPNSSAQVTTSFPGAPPSVVAKESTSREHGVEKTVNEENSGSYSPYLSPLQAQPPQTQPKLTTAATPASTKMRKFNLLPGSMDIPGLGTGPTTPAPRALSRLPTGPSNPDHASSSNPTYPTAQDMKNKAKTAMLSMWPNIRYHHYVDEGMDAAVIRALFEELDLEITSPPSNASAPPAPIATKDGEPTSTSAAVPTASSDDKGEARKDRIARMLALRKGKAPTQPGPESNAQATAPVSAPEPKNVSDSADSAPKPRPASNKDRILQQKLDALEKSRAARAQKNKKRKHSTQALGAEGTLAEAPQSAASLPANDAAPSQGVSAIPGLNLSSSSVPSITHRKRPVASDFDSDMPPSLAKRQFQPHPVGDAINGASDNEDIEMDMGSPEIPPGPSSRPGDPLNRANSTGDFFALAPNRHYASPTPFAGTPPVSGMATPQNLQGDLQRKAREIEDLKKRIAEAEARKAAQGKQVRKSALAAATNSSNTDDAVVGPTAAVSSPSVCRSGSEVQDGKEGQDGPSAQLLAESAQSIELPKRSGGGKELSKHQRRERIVSVQLPLLESSVHDKMSRVKLLEEELSKLRAELRGNLEEKQKLTEEVNLLDAKPDELQTNGPAGEATPEESAPGSISSQGISIASSGDPEPEKYTNEAGNCASPQGNVSSAKSTSPEVDTAVPAPALDDGGDAALLSQPEFPPAPPAPTMNVEADQSALPRPDGTGMESNTTPSSPQALPSNDNESADTGEAAVDVEMHNAEPAPGENTGVEPETAIPQPDVVEAQTGVIQHLSATDDILDVDMDSSTSLPQKISAGSSGILSEGDKTGAQSEARENQTRQPADQQTSTSFVPYETPLALFKAFRFHPKFRETVAGGLKSLTYSNNIDPREAFCTNELLEGSCSDSSCSLQHMKSIVAPEDRILLELGASDIYTGERKSKFMAGLRSLLTSLKMSKVRDFDMIANKIITYRAEFNGDASKVLQLEGVEI